MTVLRNDFKVAGPRLQFLLDDDCGGYLIVENGRLGGCRITTAVNPDEADMNDPFNNLQMELFVTIIRRDELIALRDVLDKVIEQFDD